MECEICGRETMTVYEVNVDGAKMLACERCSKGKSIHKQVGRKTKQAKPSASVP